MVILSTPPAILVVPSALVAGVAGLTGFSGMILRKKALATISSAVLILILISGKVVARMFQNSSPDTAILLIEFTILIVAMELSQAVLAFGDDFEPVKAKGDELSNTARLQLQVWLRNQLTGQLKLALMGLALSIALLPLAGFASLPVDQLAISASFALLAVVVLLFLLTHRREPAIQ